MIAFDDYDVGRYIADTAHCTFNPRVDHTIGMVRDDSIPGDEGRVRGGVLFTNYTGSAIWVHMAGRGTNWATPTFLWSVFHYPFEQLGVKRIYGVVEAVNEPALSIDRKLGFEVQCALPYLFASGAGLVVYMERDQCKWLDIKPRTLKENTHGRIEGGRLSGT